MSSALPDAAPQRALGLALVAIGSVVHLVFLFQVYALKSAAGLLFPLVVIAPWLLLLVSVRLAAHRRRALYVSMLASLTYLCVGAWVYWDTIYVHPDPQGGLVFLVLPVAASIAAAMLLLGLWLTRPEPTTA